MKTKKFVKIFLCITLVMSLFACGNSNTGSSENKEEYPEFLTENSWEYNTLSCTEVLSFREDGSFSYYETCGNPVGNSDMYETYSYDEEKKIITVHGYDDTVEDMEIQVLRYVEDCLLVRIDGAIKEFYAENDVPSPISDMYDEVEGYSAYLAIRNIEDGMIETAPYYMDMDAGGKALIREEKLADTVQFYHLYEELIHPSGEEPDEMSFEFTELKLEDVAYSVDNSFSSGYVWYNEDLEITKIVYYGSIEIWE